MPHDLIDNQNIKLVDIIKQTLPGSATAHFAVGYVFLSGLEAVADVLANVQEPRLLIGNLRSLAQVRPRTGVVALAGRGSQREG